MNCQQRQQQQRVQVGMSLLVLLGGMVIPQQQQ
jgi:hypothetical protein